MHLPWPRHDSLSETSTIEPPNFFKFPGPQLRECFANRAEGSANGKFLVRSSGRYPMVAIRCSANMSDFATSTASLQNCLDRFAVGDEAALNELLGQASARLEKLTRVMFRDFTRVRRWEETADVLQNASIRLIQALREKQPRDVAGFFRYAALQIRRELTDLARRYFGPEGLAANHASHADAPDTRHDDAVTPPGPGSLDPHQLALWTEFHDQAGRLPEDERDVFDLIYYQGLSQLEAGEVLGLSERTLQRRWKNARILLHDALGGQLPM